MFPRKTLFCPPNLVWNRINKWNKKEATMLKRRICFGVKQKKHVFGFVIDMSKPNERSCRFFVIFCSVFPSPQLTGLSLKFHNFFSIWSLLSLEKYVRQKYSLCLFSKFCFEFVCFPPFYPLFSKIEYFLPKITYIDGKQTN